MTSIGYMHLIHTHYERQVAIILFYINATVTIYGKHLDQLHERLVEHEVTSISEFDHNSLQGANLGDEVAIVTEIEVKYEIKEVEQEIEQMRQHAFSKKGNSGHQR